MHDTHDAFDLVIYHGNCYDGFTAAWVARRHSPAARFVAAQYQDSPPDVAGLAVLIVDFSYPRETLIQMHDDASRLLVLDHHKTAAADLAGLDFAVFDMDRSGAGLAWDHLQPGQPRPAIVDHVEDRDLWRFALDRTKELHAAMTCREMTWENWDDLHATEPYALKTAGSTILGFTRLTAQKLAARARLVMLGDVEVWAVNAPVEFVSETAEVLKQRTPHRPILGWMWDGERGDYYCSLRSRDDGPDVSAIAKLHGGGGHRNAAGFRSPQPPV